MQSQNTYIRYEGLFSTHGFYIFLDPLNMYSPEKKQFLEICFFFTDRGSDDVTSHSPEKSKLSIPILINAFKPNNMIK